MGYGTGALVCFAAFVFGAWQHNVGAMTGWLVSLIAVMKLWSLEGKSQVTNKSPALDA